MTKHDIRLRRHSLTSGRIQKHKNYRQLMKRHQRGRRLKILLGLLMLTVFLLALLSMLG